MQSVINRCLTYSESGSSDQCFYDDSEALETLMDEDVSDATSGVEY